MKMQGFFDAATTDTMDSDQKREAGANQKSDEQATDMHCYCDLEEVAQLLIRRATQCPHIPVVVHVLIAATCEAS